MRAFVIGTMMFGVSAYAAPPATLAVDTDAPFVRFSVDGKTLDFDEQGRIKLNLAPGEHELAVFRVFGKAIGGMTIDVQPRERLECFWYRDDAVMHCEADLTELTKAPEAG